MKKTLTAAALSVGLTTGFGAQAQGLSECNGQPFSGEYIVTQHPTFAPLDEQQFDQAAGRDIINSFNAAGSFILVTPTDPTQDCNDFMDDMRAIPFVDTISPNSIIRIDPIELGIE